MLNNDVNDLCVYTLRVTLVNIESNRVSKL